MSHHDRWRAIARSKGYTTSDIRYVREYVKRNTKYSRHKHWLWLRYMRVIGLAMAEMGVIVRKYARWMRSIGVGVDD